MSWPRNTRWTFTDNIASIYCVPNAPYVRKASVVKSKHDWLTEVIWECQKSNRCVGIRSSVVTTLRRKFVSGKSMRTKELGTPAACILAFAALGENPDWHFRRSSSCRSASWPLCMERHRGQTLCFAARTMVCYAGRCFVAPAMSMSIMSETNS
jgi:hypothetical protein